MADERTPIKNEDKTDLFIADTDDNDRQQIGALTRSVYEAQLSMQHEQLMKTYQQMAILEKSANEAKKKFDQVCIPALYGLSFLAYT